MSRPLSTSFRSRVTAKAHLARCEPPGTCFVVGVLHVLEDVSKQRHIKGEVPAGFLVIEVDVSRVSRSAPHVTDRAALRPSRRAVVAGKQRRGRAARPPHPCRRCGLPLRYFDPVSILPEFCT